MRRFRQVLIVAHCLGMPLASLTAWAEPRERIVSVGGDVTEILFKLGKANDIVAVDTTSRYPAEAMKLPNVGYMRRLSAEPVLALAPDHIIAIADAGPKEAVQVLRQAGVKFTAIPDEPSVEGALTKIRTVANSVDASEAGERMAAEVKARVDAALAGLPETGGKPKALFLLSVGRGSLMAGGAGSSADAMIRLAGGENIATGFQGYKPFEPEAMLAVDPEVIIVTNRTLAALGGVEAMRAQPQFAATTAARNGRIVGFDGAMLLGFGARLAEAIEALAAALHRQPEGKPT